MWHSLVDTHLRTELTELGQALTQLIEVRTTCDDAGFGMEVRRLGIAATIFHIRCISLSSRAEIDKEAAIQGIKQQYIKLTTALARIRIKDRKDRIAPITDLIDHKSASLLIATIAAIENLKQPKQ